jgi:hypothetical protein
MLGVRFYARITTRTDGYRAQVGSKESTCISWIFFKDVTVNSDKGALSLVLMSPMRQ